MSEGMPAVRADLATEQPYGAPQLDLPVVLNVNENPYPPSDATADRMGKAVTAVAKSMNRYPDREATSLRASLAEYLGFGLTSDQVWAANGSNEVMVQLFSAFGGPGRSVLLFTPTYSMYPQYARDTFTSVVSTQRYDDFSIDIDLVKEAMADQPCQIILIASPNNPTGTSIPVQVISEVCSSFPDSLVIVDEAYQEFTEVPDDSAIALLPTHSNLAVTRTMSKAFAYAGGRLGYLAASTDIVDACRIVRLPYHLSAISQAVASVALDHRDEMLAQVDELRELGADLQEWLRRMGLTVIPSNANFCLFGVFADRHAVWQEFVDRGILIREVGPEGFLRVSTGTPEEIRAFKDALTEILPTAERMDL